ncbi:hypothetical protein [Saccharopolyspora dendranthemae]|nr:hypothetical protein [Saccharopolyspora dendranthemae]
MRSFRSRRGLKGAVPLMEEDGRAGRYEAVARIGERYHLFRAE